MDAEKAALYQRRSSILKTVKRSTDDERTDEIGTQRKVSFASKYAVKPFTHDVEANTIWDATYEEFAVHSDQSTNYSNADSVSHMSIEVYNINCPAKKNMQSSDRGDSVMNNACIHLDEDIEIETEGHFAPVCQTSKSKTKFGISVEDISKDVMDITSNLVTNKRIGIADEENMELTFPIPANAPSIIDEEEDGMQFTKSLPVHLLEKLRIRNIDSEKCDKDMDITRNNQEIKCDSANISMEQCDDMDLETYARPDVPQIIATANVTHELDFVQRRSFFSQFDASFHTNPASEVDDTQYLINYNSRISEGAPIASLEPGQVKFRMNVGNPKHEIDINTIFTVEIPKIVEVPKVLQPQSCKNMEIVLNRDVMNNPMKSKEVHGGTLEVQKDSNKIRLKSNKDSRNQSIQPIKTTMDKLTVSEINVFKPSSRNNTQFSFLDEPMELGTTTVIDESIENLNKASEEPKKDNSVIKCRETIALDPETTKVSQSEILFPTTKTNELQLEEATIQTVEVLKASLAKQNFPVTVNCHEIDKIIFTTESANSFELEDAPIQAVGTLRQSLSGVAEEHHVTTNMPYQKILAEKNCLETICQAAKPIPDDSLDVIHVDDEDDEVIDNLSKSRIVLYDSDGESDRLAESCTEDLVTIVLPKKPVPLSYLKCFPANCSRDQWYDLLGVPVEDRPKELAPKVSAEERTKQRVGRELKREANKKLFERLAQKERRMEDTLAQMEREDDEEDLMRRPGRIIEDWLRQQQRLRSTLWELSRNKCVVSARSVEFNLEMVSESYVITNMIVQNVSAGKTELRQLISRLIVDKMQLSQIHGAIGSKYNLRTFLEYLQLKLESVVAIERAFMDIFGRVLVETQLSFDDNFNLQYLLIGRSRWLIEINCSDISKLSVSALTSFSTLCGDIKVPEREIKRIAKKCPTGLPFLSSFIDAVYEFRNVRERQYCKELNELLIRMDQRIADHKN